MSAIVSLSLGRLEGKREGPLYVFRGVPYARAPIGELRFRSPQPPAAWRGLRTAFTPGPTAPQALGMMRDLVAQDEDCLHLNVWTPQLDGRRSVLVFIHGGAFTSGASTHPMYDCSALAQRGDLVVVSLNYRLGALGFADLAALGSGRFAADTNVGLRDQLAALRWVQEHIAAFGGDRDQVTILGHSAGAMSVAALLTSPASSGLFARAIAHSGAGHHALSRDQAAQVAERLLDALDIEAHALERLRSLPAQAIARAQIASELMPTIVGAPGKPLINRAMGLIPVIDGDVVPELPVLASARGAGGHVPLLIGSTRDEERFWMFLSDPKQLSLTEDGLSREVASRVPGSTCELVTAYRDQLGGARRALPWKLLAAIETDRKFALPALRLCEARERASSAPSFLYRFDWCGPLFDGELGACHSMDVPFALGAVEQGFGQVFSGGGAGARDLCDRMLDAWLGFVRSSDPSSERIGAWPRFSAAGEDRCMLLAPRCELATVGKSAVHALWQELI